MASGDFNKQIVVDIVSRLQDEGFKKTIALMKEVAKDARIIQSNIQRQLTGAYDKLGSSVMTNQKNQQAYWDQYMSNTRHAKKLTGNVTKSVKGMGQAVLGASLSLMFAGMALQRAASGIYKFGTKAFQEISHSVEGTVTQMDLLDGSMKYLGFTIGQALEPFVGWLVGIVDWLQRVAEKHPGLVRILTVFGLIAGSVLMVGGQLGSFIYGLNQLSKIKFAEGIKNTFSRWGSALSNLPSKLSEVGSALKEKVINHVQWIKANKLQAITVAVVVTGILVALGWLNRLQKNMGGWDELFDNFGRGVANAFGMLAAAIEAIITKAVDMWKAIRGKQTSGYSFKEVYAEALLLNAAQIKEDFGEPAKGFIGDSKTLAEIWRGEIYPEVEAVQKEMDNISASANDITFSTKEIEDLWSKNLLDTTAIDALLNQDARNQATLSDKSEKFLKDIYQQQTGTSFTLSLDSAATQDLLAGKLLTVLNSQVQ